MGGVHVYPNIGTVSNRVTALENEQSTRAYYTVVTGTSGSIPTSSGVALIAGQFGSSGNSILSQINGSGYPIYNSPTDIIGSPVTATLNVSTGAWTTNATYTQGSVAIFFVVTGAIKDIINFESQYPSYLLVSDVSNELVAGSGISIVNNVISSKDYTDSTSFINAIIFG